MPLAKITSLDFVAPLAQPNYDQAVLVPLHTAEAAAAAQAAAEALAAQQAAAAAEAARQALIASQTIYGNNYDFGQCTYYVAGRVSVPASMGNATNWEYGLLNAGWHYGLAAGSVGVSHNGWAGHVVYVESVTNGVITISEMNAVGFDRVDTRIASPNEFIWLSR